MKCNTSIIQQYFVLHSTDKQLECMPDFDLNWGEMRQRDEEEEYVGWLMVGRTHKIPVNTEID